MKACVAVFLMQSMVCSAASHLVDSFDGPGGVLSGGTNTRLDPLDESALFGSRWIALRDRGRQADLVVTVGSGDAELQMSSALPLFTSPLPSVFFLYSSQDPIALLGSQALQLDVGSIVGRGYVYVEIDTQITPDGELNRFEITGPGLVTIPASSFSLENSNSLQGFNSLNITFEGRDPNFSLTINELRIVPEPSALFLTILGAVGLTRRRRESECRTSKIGLGLIPAAEELISDRILAAREYYRARPFETLQIVYPDASMKFPHEGGYDYDQELFGVFPPDLEQGEPRE